MMVLTLGVGCHQCILFFFMTSLDDTEIQCHASSYMINNQIHLEILYLK